MYSEQLMIVRVKCTLHTDVSSGCCHFTPPLLLSCHVLAAHPVQHAHSDGVPGLWAESGHAVPHTRRVGDQRVNVVLYEISGRVRVTVVDNVGEIVSSSDGRMLPHHSDGVGSRSGLHDLEVATGRGRP